MILLKKTTGLFDFKKHKEMLQQKVKTKKTPIDFMTICSPPFLKFLHQATLYFENICRFQTVPIKIQAQIKINLYAST